MYVQFGAYVWVLKTYYRRNYLRQGKTVQFEYPRQDGSVMVTFDTEADAMAKTAELDQVDSNELRMKLVIPLLRVCGTRVYIYRTWSGVTEVNCPTKEEALDFVQRYIDGITPASQSEVQALRNEVAQLKEIIREIYYAPGMPGEISARHDFEALVKSVQYKKPDDVGMGL